MFFKKRSLTWKISGPPKQEAEVKPSEKKAAPVAAPKAAPTKRPA